MQYAMEENMEQDRLAVFRAEVADFLRQHVPECLARKFQDGMPLSREEMMAWHQLLYRQGWLASHWPCEYGGAGWDAAQRQVFQDEIARIGVPRVMPFMFGVDMLAPVLIRYGSDAHKRFWLPRILDGSDWWCQGFSEPGAGSDLASLRTSARLETQGDSGQYVVNGQKTWISYGHYANMMFCLVRTSETVRPQQGISMLLIDLRSAGVEVRPIITLEGAHFVNEVFFTDVRVPPENLVGIENEGWAYAKYLLTYERTNIAGVAYSQAALSRLERLAAARRRHGRPLSEDAMFAARFAKAQIGLDNLRTTNQRLLRQASGNAAHGAESSLLKLAGSRVRQDIDALMKRAAGPEAQALMPDMAPMQAGGTGLLRREGMTAMFDYLQNRKLSILGGTNEVQRNIVAQAVLGL